MEEDRVFEIEKISVIDAFHKCLDLKSWRRLANVDGFFMLKKTKEANFKAFQKRHPIYSLLKLDDTNPQPFKIRLADFIVKYRDETLTMPMKNIIDASDEDLAEILSGCMTPQQLAELADFERFKNLFATGEYCVETIGYLTSDQVKDIYGQDEGVVKKIVVNVRSLKSYRALAALTTVGKVVFAACENNANLCLGVISSNWLDQGNYDRLKETLKVHINKGALDKFKLEYGAAELLTCLLKISEFGSEGDGINVDDQITPEMIKELAKQNEFPQEFPFQVVKLLTQGKCLDVLKPGFLPHSFVFKMQPHVTRQDDLNYNIQDLYKQEAARVPLFLAGHGLQTKHYVDLINNAGTGEEGIWICDQVFADINLCDGQNENLNDLLTTALDEITNPEFFASLLVSPNGYLIPRVFAEGWDYEKLKTMYDIDDEGNKNLSTLVYSFEVFTDFLKHYDIAPPPVPNADDKSFEKTPPKPNINRNLPTGFTPQGQLTPGTLTRKGQLTPGTLTRVLKQTLDTTAKLGRGKGRFDIQTPEGVDDSSGGWGLDESDANSTYTTPVFRKTEKKTEKKEEKNDDNNNYNNNNSEFEDSSIAEEGVSFVITVLDAPKLEEQKSPNGKLEEKFHQELQMSKASFFSEGVSEDERNFFGLSVKERSATLLEALNKK